MMYPYLLPPTPPGGEPPSPWWLVGALVLMIALVIALHLFGG